MKKVRFKEEVQVFPVPKHDECRHNEWIRRKIDFERRVFRLENLLQPVIKMHLKCFKRKDLSDVFSKLNLREDSSSDSDFEIVFE